MWDISALSVADFAQHARLVELQLPDDSASHQAGLVVERFRGVEGVNALFTFEVDVLASSVNFDPSALIGEELTLRLLKADGSKRAWHGILTGCDALGGDGGLARFKLHLQPWLAHARLRRDTFVFANKNVQDILGEVFADYPLAHFAFEVSRALPVHATRVQYRESDLDFLLRTLAAEGLSFRFEHEQDGGAQDSPSPSRHRLVIFDEKATLPGNPDTPLRYHRIDATETRDAFTQWKAVRAVAPNAVTVSAWDHASLAAAGGGATTALELGTVPPLELHDGRGAQRYLTANDAVAVAERQLAVFEAQAKQYEGVGSVRTLAPGQRFALSQHERYGQEAGDRQYIVTRLEHEAANNLGAQAAHVLESGSLEHGSYRNRVHAQDGKAALFPPNRPKPTAPEATVALVVGDAAGGEEHALPAHTQRDHRVQVRFYWQPMGGGQGQSAGDALIAAGRRDNATPSVWLRVAAPVAGPNWGAHLLPRVGTEVLVSFIDGDIDRPVVSHQLYNQQDLPPWSAGTDSGANHPGTLSGWHSKSLDGNGFNQWLTDDATGQVRTRLASSQSTSQLNLGYLNNQRPTSATRGKWRGTGAELRSDAWVTVRAGDGMLVSSTAQLRGHGPMLNAPGPVGQVQAALEAAEQINDAVQQGEGVPLAANSLLQPLIDDLDPSQKGKYASYMGGQQAVIPAGGSREGEDPVPGFARPVILLDAGTSLNASTPASANVFAGGALHWTSQLDAQLTAGKTVSLASATSTGLFVQRGGLTAIAQAGPVSVQAHEGKLAWTAQEDVTVNSVGDSIEVLAATRITVGGGQTSIVLDGPNITLTMPGKLDIKGATKSFIGPGADPAIIPALPVGAFGTPPSFIEIERWYHDETPVHGADVKVKFSDGSIRTGKLSDEGKLRIDGVPSGSAEIEIGEDVRDWKPHDTDEPIPNPAYGRRLTPEQAEALYALYLEQINNG